MRVIYKYPIPEITGVQVIKMPAKAIRTVGLDPKGWPCIWAEVETDAELVPVTVYIVGTGEVVPANALTFIGTFIRGPFVWHVYI